MPVLHLHNRQDVLGRAIDAGQNLAGVDAQVLSHCDVRLTSRTLELSLVARKHPVAAQPELSTGATTHLGKTQPGALIKARLSYTAQLPKASLPPGIYRLRALAVVQATPPITAFLEVPLLQVAEEF